MEAGAVLVRDLFHPRRPYSCATPGAREASNSEECELAEAGRRLAEASVG